MARVPARVWAALAVVAAAVRLYRLDHFSYWLDEILQSYFIHSSWKFLWSKLAEDAVHPPLDYIVTKLFADRGASEWVMKLPDVVWGSASVVVLGRLIERRVGAVAGIVSALFLALAPFHVRYSQELRPYALGVLLFLFSLLSLDIALERPGFPRIAALYLSCLATAYALYLSAVVLAIGGGAIVLEDAWAKDPLRRSNARRSLAWSPVFVLLLCVGYLPWIPVVRDAARRTPFTGPPEMSISHLSRVLAFFSFAPNEGYPLGAAGVFYLLLALIGLLLCLRRPGMRFVAGWLILGSVAVEILEHLHPHFFAPRHFLPVAVGIPVLVAVAVTSLGRWNLLRASATAVLIGLIVFFDVRGLSVYFREGRPDWRPLTSFLQKHHGSERIVTDSQWTQLCVAYYVFGPSWLCCGDGRQIVFVNGKLEPLAWLHEPGQNLWLVASDGPGASPDFRRFVERHALARFPTADGAIVGKLPP